MKNFINKILDLPKLIRRILIILWLILIMLLIFKFCFGIWYPVIVNNETFSNICDFIDNKEWLKKTIKLVFYVLSSNFLFLTITNSKKYSKWYFLIIFNIIYVGLFLIKTFWNTIGSILEVVLVIFAIIYDIKKNKFKNNVFNVLIPLLIYGVLNLWLLLMALVRGLDTNNFLNYPFVIQIIMQLDYYIFLTITFVEVCYMGDWTWGWFWSKDITVLKAEKEKELSKAKPNMKKINSIDIKIAELEKEAK